jgi:hypothetical protein
MSVPKWYEELPRFTITVNAWDAGIITGAIMNDRDKVPTLWKQLMELRKSIEAGDGVTREFLPDGLVKVTNIDGISITRPCMPWDMPDEP